MIKLIILITAIAFYFLFWSLMVYLAVRKQARDLKAKIKSHE